MGGGDLNMKKHFHPLTMQNLERVWKAEQKAKEEAEKLEQLQRELEEERRREALQQHAVEQGIVKKKNEKLSWMYAGPQVNHEEYLLGRKIDKNIDILKEPSENAEEQTPGASFVTDIADPVKDMAAKIKEDPLFLIKKKEDDSKKELIKNPIKLRKLKEMLNMSVDDKHKHRKHKKDKHKKHKKEKRRDRSPKKEQRHNGYKIEKRSKDSKINQNSDSDSEFTDDELSRGRDSKSIKRSSSQSYGVNERIKRNGKSQRTKYDSSDSEADKRKSASRKSSKYYRENDNIKRRYSSDSEDERSRLGREGLSKKGRQKSSGDYREEERKESRKYGLLYTKNGNERSNREQRGHERDSNETHSRGNMESRQKDRHSQKRYHHGGSEDNSEFQSYNGSDSPLNKRKRYSQSKNGSSRVSKTKRRDASASSSSEDESQRRSTKDQRYSRKRKSSSDSDSSLPQSKSVRKAPSNHKERPPRMIANNISRKLTAEELEKKRKEMMENAKWRDDQRGKNVNQYKLEDEKEEKSVEKQLKSFDRESKAKFIHEMQVKSYSSSSTASVEDRIKRNIYTKQRTQAALNKKFTEK